MTKIVKLTKDMFFKGRWRRKGEVLPVNDNFSDGKTLVKDSHKKHKKPKKNKKLKRPKEVWEN